MTTISSSSLQQSADKGLIRKNSFALNTAAAPVFNKKNKNNIHTPYPHYACYEKKEMGLNRYDALHIFTILWLSTVSISLVSLSIRHEQTDQRVQKSLDALENQNSNNPFIIDIGLDIDRNNDRDSVKVEEEKSNINSEPLNDNIEDEKISVDVKEQDLVQEVEGIIISSSQSRHKEKPANFESALNAFSDELERYVSSKRKKRRDTAFHRQLRSFDVDSREYREKSREAIQIHRGRQRETSLKSLSENVEHKDKHDKSIIRRSHYRKASHTSTDLTLLKLDDFQQNEKFMKERASKKKSIEAIENGHIRTRRVESPMNNSTTLYRTSCVLTEAEIVCDDDYEKCSKWASQGECANTTFMPNTDITYQDWMVEYCRKSCNVTCPPLPPLENQVHHEEIENIISTFSVSLNVNTDDYAIDTSWLLSSKNIDDSAIINSSETSASSQLVNNELHTIEYNCTVTKTEEKEKENQLSDDDKIKSTCYNFEVHDSYGDGMCCEYGAGFFSMSVNTINGTLEIENDLEGGSIMSTSFCVNHDSGQIESEGRFIKTKKDKTSLSHYPFESGQCKNDPCLCDSKPSLSGKIQENHEHAFLFEVTMLSSSDKLLDVESPQYKAACWVLYDDLYDYAMAGEGAYAKRMQRYILATFYFAASPENWKERFHFLSSLSECDWNYIEYDSTYGISCDGDGNVIEMKLNRSNLEGAIAEELSGLKMLEYLDLGSNNINGSVPPVLGRLSELRRLDLSENNLEGTIPLQLFNIMNLEKLNLGSNKLEGTIHETIGNLQKLSDLQLCLNDLSGSIPDALYALKNLQSLELYDNKLSSSISPLIGNLRKLQWLHLSYNMLTGQIPSTIGSLSSLQNLYLRSNRLSGSIPSIMGNMKSLSSLVLENNTLSGPIPDSLFDLPRLDSLQLQDNIVTGSIPDELCDRVRVEADCQNDIFDPEVSCSCCFRCTDKTPTWNGNCKDTTLNVVIDYGSEHFGDDYHGLEWSLTNDATGKKVFHDGPYIKEEGLQSYEACVVHSDCFSLNQISLPFESNTNYYIYWNNESIHEGTFLGYDYDYHINETHLPQTILTFQYDEENQNITSCYDMKLECYEEEQPIHLEPNTTERITYDQAIKLSGKDKIKDTSSPQSKALCWMIKNNTYDNKTDKSDTDINQRYVLAILHFMSQDNLFADDEYPPNTHECDWNGIACIKNNVTGISLSYENNQIINGTLIDEIGHMKYLQVLELHNKQLYGTIPRSFSNLWSLRKLVLSNNKISNTIPTTLFRQLNKLELIDLSDNLLNGTIKDIGSYSHIHALLLRNNSLTGPFPLDTFKHTDLWYLDISENELNDIDFSLLLKHKYLEKIDLSNNFFVGNLLENTFTSLLYLRYLDVSQNDISGTIPSTFPELSKITHLDMHDNRLKGPIPIDIEKLISIQHLNLQGNQLTGSLPGEINQLKSLETLVLSHNELKGSIPFDSTALQNMKILHLHSNPLVGEAPSFKNMNSYITDCGFPSDLTDPVTCPTCDKCCNSSDRCRMIKVDYSTIIKTLQFSLILYAFLHLCYTNKEDKCFERFFTNSVSKWNAMEIINDRSVYHFLLTKNIFAQGVGLLTGIFQILSLFLFLIEASSYSLKCPSYRLECEDTEPGINASPWGLATFGLILAIWLARDLVSSIKLLLIAMQKKSKKIMFAAGLLFFITMLAAWTSVQYNLATVTTDSELIVNTVVLLFVLEADERLYQLAACCHPDLVKDVEDVMEENRNETNDNDEENEDEPGGDINANSNEEEMGQRLYEHRNLIFIFIIVVFYILCDILDEEHHKK